jgi:hypothetical protein
VPPETEREREREREREFAVEQRFMCTNPHQARTKLHSDRPSYCITLSQRKKKKYPSENKSVKHIQGGKCDQNRDS